ncbi:MAG: hypothetical protein WDN45_14335 [Caulobacteraceae bacterium]
MATVSEALAAAFRPGDRLVVVQESGALLHVPAAVQAIADEAVGRAHGAFQQMGQVSDEQISRFFKLFAARLDDDRYWAPIVQANEQDAARARAAGRSTTRLVVSEQMRLGMVMGLRGWAEAPAGRGRTLEQVQHDGWSVELLTAPLGVVAFVFEGPAQCVRRRLRRAALGQYRRVPHRLGRARHRQGHRRARPGPGPPGRRPARGRGGLVASPERSAGWAMFSDRRLALAVARGSGAAVAQLGAVGAPGRGAGEPARHGRSVAGGRAGRRRRTLRRRGRAFPGPQGVQHPQRLLRRPEPGGRACAPVPGRPGQGGKRDAAMAASCTSPRRAGRSCPTDG